MNPEVSKKTNPVKIVTVESASGVKLKFPRVVDITRLPSKIAMIGTLKLSNPNLNSQAKTSALIEFLEAILEHYLPEEELEKWQELPFDEYMDLIANNYGEEDSSPKE